MKEKLRLYHTNDLHSHFENWPKIVDYIEQKRKEHQSDGEETLVIRCHNDGYLHSNGAR